MKKRLLIFTILLSFLSAVTFAVKADDNAGFTSQAILEKHQKDKNLTYWWLSVKSDETMTLKLKITNESSQNATFDISANQAITNSNLVVDYAQSQKKVLSNLTAKPKFDFYKAILLGNEKKAGQISLNLKGNGSIELPITVKIPKAGFDGQLVGGINVTKHVDEAQRKNGLLNVYSTATALVLESGKQAKLKPLQISQGQLSLSKQEISIANLQNLLLRDLTIHAKIKDKNGKIFAQLDNEKAALTPMTKAEIPLYNLSNLTKNKDYQLEISVDYHQKNLKNFHEIYQMNVNQSGVIKVIKPQEKSQKSHWIVISVIIVFLIVIFVGIKKIKGKK